MTKPIVLIAFLVLCSTLYGQLLEHINADQKGYYIVSLIKVGRYDRIPDVIKAGANVNVRCGLSSWPVINHAVMYAPSSVVKLLLDAGADPAQVTNGDDALRICIQKKNCSHKEISFLLPYCSLESSLWVAAKHGKEDVVQLLFDAGAQLKWLEGKKQPDDALVRMVTQHAHRVAIRSRIIIQCLEERNGFPRDLTRMFWDIADLAQAYKPALHSYK